MFDFVKNITFANPIFLWLLLLLPLLGFWYYRNYRQYYAALNMPTLEGITGISLRGRLRSLLPLLRGLTILALIFALARPQKVLQEEEVKADGIDIALVMDLSSSMLAQDFTPNRLEVSKRVASEFVDKRQFDRIGLVVFAGEAFTRCPLITDHRIVKENLASLQCGEFLDDGTAIGMGLSTAVNRMKDSETKSKVVILLTDGVNNTGYQSPKLAAQIAKKYKVKVYTIGVGSMGETLTPVSRRSDGRYVFGIARVEIDEALLQEIAEMTGGKYYRATSAESLEKIYASIDQLEKTEIDITAFKRYSEEFYRFAFFGLLMLLLEVMLRYTVLRVIP